MTCFSPLLGYKSRSKNPTTGKRSIVFNPKLAYSDLPVKIPCGQCIGCRLEHSRQWAIRCTHEASLYEKNCFITLTYDDTNLPNDYSLDVRHFQLFMKRLRKKYGTKIRFYHCGEYGENTDRPHYHACLFNHDFSDKKPWKQINDNTLYTSESLENLWGLGFTSLGDVTFQSAAYVARYIVKKITGEHAENYYQHLDSQGELHDRCPPYTTMSRRPGIGKLWLNKYQTDVYPSDQVILNGKTMRPPKYYDKQMENAHCETYAKIRNNRILKSKKHLIDQTPERLRVRQIVQASKLDKLPRKDF